MKSKRKFTLDDPPPVPPMPDEMTIREKYDPAMSITDQVEADRYFERCVEHTMRFGNDRAKAESIERQNLGYYAGYFDHATRIRVERLFRCAHPIFGSAAVNGEPSAEEALAAGRMMGERAKRQKS